MSRNPQNEDDPLHSAFAPRSPEGPPPSNTDITDDDGDDDAFLVRMLKVREIAIRLAGGEDMWDGLDEDEADDLKERAEMELDSQP